MTDKTETAADLKAREEADKAAEAAKKEPQGEAQKAAELEAKADEAKAAHAKGKKVKGEGPRSRVLEKKAFINGRLYEAGETVDEDADGNFVAVPKSTPAGNLTVEQLKQLLAQKEASARAGG